MTTIAVSVPAQDSRDRRIPLGALDCFGDRRRDTGTEGIYRRVVDGNDGDAVFNRSGYNVRHNGHSLSVSDVELVASAFRRKFRPPSSFRLKPEATKPNQASRVSSSSAAICSMPVVLPWPSSHLPK